MLRYLLTNGGMLHIADIGDDRRVRTQESCNLDDTTGWRVLKLGEEQGRDYTKCGNCFPDRDDSVDGTGPEP